jgi:hypothetical protein
LSEGNSIPLGEGKGGASFTPEQTLSINKAIERGLKKIYTGSYTGKFPEEFWEITTAFLNEAVDTEFGNQYKPLANHLKYQNSVFSAFKSANQTQTLNNLLAASKAKTFTDFAVEVQSVVDDYNINHLRVEWATAKKAMRTAKRWAKALEDADIFPNIEYLESTAKEPRDKHKVYYGMIRPIDDVIWNTILPPSDWGCQCGWRTTDKPTTGIPSDSPKADPGLDNNPGKDGAAFSQSHPYFKGKGAEEILKNNLSAMYGIDPKDLTEFYFDKKTKGCIFSVEKVRKEGEFAKNMKTADVLKNNGNIVELLKRSNVKGIKSIDAMVNGFPTEFKDCSSATSIDTQLRKANSQAKDLPKGANAVIYMTGKMEETAIREAIRSRLTRAKNIKDVFVVQNGKLWKY